MKRAKLPYVRPVLAKVRKMRFPFDILEDHGQRRVCKQCSSCHTCR